MLSDEQIRSDLAKLRDIVKAHKAPEADLAIHQEEIDGIRYESPWRKSKLTPLIFNNLQCFDFWMF